MNYRFFCSGLLGLAVSLVSLQLQAFQAATLQQAAPASQQDRQSNTSTSRKNMVASVHPQATQAGLEAFAKGGNAIDAAIATALTLGVVDNYNSGIGGGCFILIRTAEGDFFAIDGQCDGFQR